MKNYFVTVLIVLFLFSFNSCNDEKNKVSGGIYGTWEIVDFMSIEARVYAKKDNYNPIIDFKTDGTYSVKLDANSCLGTFKISGVDKISITAPGCTKMCCDSEYSKKVVIELSKVATYTLENDEIKFDVPRRGWLQFKRVKK